MRTASNFAVFSTGLLRSCSLAVLGVVLGASLASPAAAQTSEDQYKLALRSYFLGVREYNLVTFGDFTRANGATGTDTWGAVAVGGNFDFAMTTLVNESKYSPRDTVLPDGTYRSRASDPEVLINGELVPRVGGGSFELGNLGDKSFAINPAKNNSRFFWDSSQSRYTYGTPENRGAYFVAASNPETAWTTATNNLARDGWSIDAMNPVMNRTQDLLRAHAQTGVTITPDGDANNLKGNVSVASGSIGYWNISTSSLDDYKVLTFDVPSNSVLVVNLSANGGDVIPSSLQTAVLNGSESRILWNISMTPSSNQSYASTLTFEGSSLVFWGSVLAPDVDIVGNRIIQGQVLANSFALGNNELHMAYFQPTMDLVIPEPATCAAIAGGLALAFAVWRKRRGATQDVAA